MHTEVALLTFDPDTKQWERILLRAAPTVQEIRQLHQQLQSESAKWHDSGVEGWPLALQLDLKPHSTVVPKISDHSMTPADAFSQWYGATTSEWQSAKAQAAAIETFTDHYTANETIERFTHLYLVLHYLNPYDISEDLLFALERQEHLSH